MNTTNSENLGSIRPLERPQSAYKVFPSRVPRGHHNWVRKSKKINCEILFWRALQVLKISAWSIHYEAQNQLAKNIFNVWTALTYIQHFSEITDIEWKWPFYIPSLQIVNFGVCRYFVDFELCQNDSDVPANAPT